MDGVRGCHPPSRPAGTSQLSASLATATARSSGTSAFVPAATAEPSQGPASASALTAAAASADVTTIPRVTFEAHASELLRLGIYANMSTPPILPKNANGYPTGPIPSLDTSISDPLRPQYSTNKHLSATLVLYLSRPYSRKFHRHTH
jgi:hypothetical protein